MGASAQAVEDVMVSTRHREAEASVLLVTGAYYPEISSGGQQCRAVVRALDGRIRCAIIATSAAEMKLPAESEIDGIRVLRVPITVGQRLSRIAAAFRVARIFLTVGRHFQVVHLHGISAKNIAITWLARLFGMRIVLTLHTAGHDEADVVRQRSRAEFRTMRAADRVLSVSRRLSERYCASGLPAERLVETFNGIDTNRFRPASPEERRQLRDELGLPRGPIVLFVGYFSRDKRPDALFEAWSRIANAGPDAPALVCVGATRSTYFEIDPSLAERMLTDARRLGLSDRLQLIPPTNEIEKLFRAADLFVLPSIREAMPVALLEAMACGVACIASNLPGATDVIIADGVNGRLVPPGDVTALAGMMARVLARPEERARLGESARRTIEERYDVRRAADDWLAAYRHVLASE